jgi:hypothetical protein
MCHTAVGLISDALHEVDNAESLLKIKNLVALFMQAMDVCSPDLFILTNLEAHITHRRGIFPSEFSTIFY